MCEKICMVQSCKSVLKIEGGRVNQSCDGKGPGYFWMIRVDLHHFVPNSSLNDQ